MSRSKEELAKIAQLDAVCLRLRSEVVGAF